MANKIVWSQYFDNSVKEVTNIDFGQTLLLADGGGWKTHTFYNCLLQDGEGVLDPDIRMYNARVKFKWTGEYPLHNCKFVLVASKNYNGSSDADVDLAEIQDWAYNGEYGFNRFPTACQLYNPCYIVITDDPKYPEGYYVHSWDDNAGDYQICANLAERSHNRCLPCIGDVGNIDNLNYSDEWPWVDDKDRRVMYVYSGGLIMWQQSTYTTIDLVEESILEDEDTGWKQFNNISTPAFSIPVVGNIIEPDVEINLYLRVCIPWGCFCGGKRCVGLGVDYIYTK